MANDTAVKLDEQDEDAPPPWWGLTADQSEWYVQGDRAHRAALLDEDEARPWWWNVEADRPMTVLEVCEEGGPDVARGEPRW